MSHEFGVYQRFQTSSNHCITERTQPIGSFNMSLVGEVHMSSMWFNANEAFRTAVYEQ